MKRLILTRHAKSDWNNLNLTDHERPLNPRGRAGCYTIARWLLDQTAIPAEVLSSTATRCAETWMYLNAELNTDAKVQYESGLYHASSQQMMNILRTASADTVILLGHNPGISDFADRILKQSPNHAKFATYPSAATLIADFEIDDWADLKEGTGTCTAFTVPKDHP